ncbi:unnamed protein product [Paramecium octaurelia]|uniref:Uncharacterized protein n=1 Tax=Paramecium octaurelia TaxID=43137 RepID=A0A8S1UQV1_PAROT|nr:unnamed protein product [Paramecium octaurelia]
MKRGLFYINIFDDSPNFNAYESLLHIYNQVSAIYFLLSIVYLLELDSHILQSSGNKLNSLFYQFLDTLKGKCSAQFIIRITKQQVG